MMGDFEGGALELADGRRFTRKYHWYRYNGAVTAHGVAPFTGERLTVVLYQEHPKTTFYAMVGSQARSMNPDTLEKLEEEQRAYTEDYRKEQYTDVSDPVGQKL